MTRFYHHEFKHAEDYLHHRPPSLMVDRILSIDDRVIETAKTFTGEEGFLKGHFPGLPIFPGAMMQELSTQSAGVMIAARYNPMPEYNTHDPDFNSHALGVLVGVKRAKFRGFARPGDELVARVVLHEIIGNLFDFSATLSVGDRTIMRNAFQLTNVPSAVLRGESASGATA
jgi:3-hydroxyacyl-[acyl-carrier-protein] dehydratase